MAAIERAEPVDPAGLHRLADLAEGLQVLIRFHDREIDTPLLAELAHYAIADDLAALLPSPEGRAAAALLSDALTALGPAPSDDALDDLAADYADLFLTHGYRVSPSGSVWLTEDKLERQQPMFDVRDWYAHYGITVPDWRIRADDHLVYELEFVAHLCRAGNTVAATDAAHFLDLHVLPWLPEFCTRAETRVHAPLYAAVMALTRTCLTELRTTLETLTGLAPDIRPLPGTGAGAAAAAEADQPYIPGVSESW